jgi:ribosome-associated protein
MALSIEEKTRVCVLAADSRKAHNIVVLDVEPLSSVADRFLMCSGASDRQIKAIADAIRDELSQQGEKPLAVEGYDQGTWILIDCVDLILHIFDDATRDFYNLEHLWHQAPRIEVAGLLPATPTA